MLWLRRIGGALVGAILFGLTVTVVETLNWQLFPLPAGVDPGDPAQMAAAVQSIPFIAKAIVLKGYFLGALIGGWSALAIARWVPALLVVVGMAWLGAAFNIMAIPHPVWMAIGSFVAPALGGWLALWLDGWARRRAA